MVTSGIRLGTPAATSRGSASPSSSTVGDLIVEALDGLAKNGPEGNGARRGIASRSGPTN